MDITIPEVGELARLWAEHATSEEPALRDSSSWPHLGVLLTSERYADVAEACEQAMTRDGVSEMTAAPVWLSLQRVNALGRMGQRELLDACVPLLAAADQRLPSLVGLPDYAPLRRHYLSHLAWRGGVMRGDFRTAISAYSMMHADAQTDLDRAVARYYLAWCMIAEHIVNGNMPHIERVTRLSGAFIAFRDACAPLISQADGDDRKVAAPWVDHAANAHANIGVMGLYCWLIDPTILPDGGSLELATSSSLSAMLGLPDEILPLYQPAIAVTKAGLLLARGQTSDAVAALSPLMGDEPITLDTYWTVPAQSLTAILSQRMGDAETAAGLAKTVIEMDVPGVDLAQGLIRIILPETTPSR